MLLARQTLGAAQALTLAGVGIVAPISKIIAGAAIYASLTGVAGGTTADFYVQTDFGDGQFWDVCNFHFGIANLTEMFNVSADAAVAGPGAFTNGTIAANTVNPGFLGSRFQVKWTSTGTYTGGLVQVFLLPRSGR